MPPLLREQLQNSYGEMPSANSSDTGSSSNNNSGRIKCVLVGDGAVGKTSLIVSYTTNGYPTEYIPTAFDNYNVVVNVDNQPILLQLCDTAGQDDFDNLRTLCYDSTDVYVVCFSVVSPASFANVASRWLPEIRRHSPDTPVILVGTQADLRSDVKVLIELARYGEKPVGELEAIRLADRLGARTYVESSALTQRNLKEVFDEAIVAALSSNEELRRLTAASSSGRSRTGNRLLNSIRENWRLSQSSGSTERGGLLLRCSLRRSKMADNNISSSKQPASGGAKKNPNKKNKPSLWKRLLCCQCCCVSSA
ncbi:cell division control protein 42 homolog [Daphnia magna]|uniref:Rho-related GTP-binding protein RhoU n=2 Tax=Daphnia TaxID=6668 RepID=A0AAD5PMA9_9CRUS|nr:cell division control protein 42 homolog [Daphnia magna]KAI9551852.1 hypothetical protein GHT06_022188 [Daphnia sinensis]KZS15951.1 putative Rho-related GTP-binding protein RhoU [Daphnia magna]